MEYSTSKSEGYPVEHSQSTGVPNVGGVLCLRRKRIPFSSVLTTAAGSVAFTQTLYVVE